MFAIFPIGVTTSQKKGREKPARVLGKQLDLPLGEPTSRFRRNRDCPHFVGTHVICAVLFPEKTYSPGLSGVVMEEKSVLGTSILLLVPSFPAVPQLKGFKDPHTSQKRPPRHLRHLDLGPMRLEFGGRRVRPRIRLLLR